MRHQRRYALLVAISHLEDVERFKCGFGRAFLSGFTVDANNAMADFNPAIFNLGGLRKSRIKLETFLSSGLASDLRWENNSTSASTRVVGVAAVLIDPVSDKKEKRGRSSAFPFR